MMNLKPIWDKLIIFEKKKKKSEFFSSFGVPKEESQIHMVPQRKNCENFFLAIFIKKGHNCSEYKRKCPLWWIWAYLRWIDNFWKKIWKYLKKIFFSNFQKKGLNCSELKESVHNDEFEAYLRWIDNFWKKNLKKSEKFFLAIFRKKVSIALNWKDDEFEAYLR